VARLTRNLQALSEHPKSADVVAVLVSDEDGVDVSGALATGREAAQQLFAGKSGVDQ
jgi:hypothetical protein